MRILLVTPFLPHPAARHGGGVALATLAAGWMRYAEVGLAALASPQEDTILAQENFGWSWAGTAPARPRPAGVRRLPHQLRMLWRWRDTPLVAAKYHSPAMAALLRRARTEFDPDVAFLEMAQTAQFLPALAGLPTVLTDHEAGCPANTATGLGPLGDRRDRRLWWRYVDRFYPLATRLQALTPEDAAVLGDRLGRPVAVRGSVFPVAEAPVRPGAAPPRALFLGDYSHGPNPEAAAILAREVLPRIRARMPNAELWLGGPHEERLAAIAGEPGVRVLGFVPDLHGLLQQVRLLLAPAFSGTGIRTKCIAAFANGLPVVTNALGARGADVPEPARLVAEGPAALADAALRLLTAPDLAEAGGRSGYEWARANVAVDAIARAQVERARELVRPPQ
ncbi:MAG: glycosyltransferase [Planctomycetes bacterium]|nr:glycosyltransferase [Planctomycetota bacterium]